MEAHASSRISMRLQLWSKTAEWLVRIKCIWAVESSDDGWSCSLGWLSTTEQEGHFEFVSETWIFLDNHSEIQLIFCYLEILFVPLRIDCLIAVIIFNTLEGIPSILINFFVLFQSVDNQKSFSVLKLKIAHPHSR